MGNNISEIVKERYVNFEDVQFCIRNRNKYPFVIINTMPANLQSCLISSTVNALEEESVVNQLLNINKGTSWFSLQSQHNRSIDNVTIVLYGKNNNEQNVYNKFSQLQSLGFANIYIYPGGMFEWLQLQDIYGDAEFPTTTRELDILRYKPNSSKMKKLQHNSHLLTAS